MSPLVGGPQAGPRHGRHHGVAQPGLLLHHGARQRLAGGDLKLDIYTKLDRTITIIDNA